LKDRDLAQSISDLIPIPEFDNQDGLTSIGRTITIKGQIHSNEPLIVEGKVEGHIAAPKHGVAIAKNGTVGPEVFARTITIRGKASGNITAIENLELLESADVQGRLVARQVTIEEGAYFSGVVDPKLADTAIAVGLHRLTKQKENIESE